LICCNASARPSDRVSATNDGVRSRRWPEHGEEERLDVAGDDVIASLHQRPRARGALERQAPADRSARRDPLDATGRAHEVDDPEQHELVDVHVLDSGSQRLHVVRVDPRLQARDWMTVALRDHDLHLFVAGRIAERGAQREPVELRLGSGNVPPARSGSPSR
jgi:hypothetical protein